MRRNLSWAIISVLILSPWAAPRTGAAEVGKIAGELKKWQAFMLQRHSQVSGRSRPGKEGQLNAGLLQLKAKYLSNGPTPHH